MNNLPFLSKEQKEKIRIASIVLDDFKDASDLTEEEQDDCYDDMEAKWMAEEEAAAKGTEESSDGTDATEAPAAEAPAA